MVVKVGRAAFQCLACVGAWRGPRPGSTSWGYRRRRQGSPLSVLVPSRLSAWAPRQEPGSSHSPAFTFVGPAHFRECEVALAYVPVRSVVLAFVLLRWRSWMGACRIVLASVAVAGGPCEYWAQQVPERADEARDPVNHLPCEDALGILVRWFFGSCTRGDRERVGCDSLVPLAGGDMGRSFERRERGRQ
ncbi:hypothetical protein Emed_004428 [Eimeria media]